MTYRLSKTENSKGFTIVELLIVVVVIAILAAITIVAYSGIRQRAEASALAAELSQIHRTIQTDVLKTTGVTVDIKVPIAYATKQGDTTLSAPLVAAQNVTLYGVFDATNNPAAAGWSGIVALNPNGTNNSMRLRTGASADNTARGFYATSAQTNRDLTKNSILNNANRHIGWMAANPTTIESSYDKLSDGTAALTAHTGWNFDTVTLYSGGAYTSVAALVFAEYHDAATRAQIVEWLNQKYTVGL